MEVTIARGHGNDTAIVISNEYIYLYDSTAVTIHDMKGHVIQTVRTHDFTYMMTSSNRGLLLSTKDSVLTLSHDGIISPFTDQLFNHIYEIGTLRNGNVAILTDIFLYIYTDTAHLLIRHDIDLLNKDVYCEHMTLLADGSVGIVRENFMHIYTSTGKTERAVYVGNINDHCSLTELYDGRFCTIAHRSYMIIWPRRDGRLTYSSTPVSFGPLTQLFDGRIMSTSKDSIDIYTVQCVLDKVIPINGYQLAIYQLSDSRLLLVSEQHITLYLLNGNIDLKFDCGQCVNKVNFDGLDKLVYICDDQTVRIFTVPPKHTVYDRRLDRLCDMCVRFN